jgi:hypothetical protein
MEIKKMSVRDYDVFVYEYFERNKDYICDQWNIPYFNTTDMKKKYIKWGRKNNDARLYDTETKMPSLMLQFLENL